MAAEASAGASAGAKSQFIGYKASGAPGFPPHVCPSCKQVINLHGRLNPCNHLFCYPCTLPQLEAKSCLICKSTVASVWKVTDDMVFVCTLPTCRRSYKYHYSLVEHQRIRHSNNQGAAAAGAANPAGASQAASGAGATAAAAASETASGASANPSAQSQPRNQ